MAYQYHVYTTLFNDDGSRTTKREGIFTEEVKACNRAIILKRHNMARIVGVYTIDDETEDLVGVDFIGRDRI